MKADDGVTASASTIRRHFALGLLAINHAISTEAKIVLYGSNVWHLSAETRALGANNIDQFNELWKANQYFFRHLTVTFDRRDLHRSELVEYVNSSVFQMHQHREEWRIRQTQQRRSKEINALLGIAWARKLGLIEQMDLSTLVIDVKNCFSPSTCRRLLLPLLKDQSLMGLDDWDIEHEMYNIDDDPFGFGDWITAPDDSDLFFGDRIRSLETGVWDRIKELRMTGLVGRKKHRLVHRLGLACVVCQVKDRVCDTANCA